MQMSSGDANDLSSSSFRGFIQDPNYDDDPSSSNPNSNQSNKRKRNLPGTPDPEAEVIALSPKSLMATNRFLCEICSKGFQRDQNLQLHRRGHNLPWKLKQRNKQEPVRKKVYVCPEKTCVHHEPSRALGDLTGIKKHYSRKHGEKKWKCEKCSKKYAVQSDWKAHMKVCGTREYKCDCGTIFSRKDSFITHRAFCDALAEERTRFTPQAPPSADHHVSSFGGQISNLYQNPESSSQLMAAAAAMFSRPQFSGLEIVNDHAKPRLPMWLNNTSSSQFLPSSSITNMPLEMPQSCQWSLGARGQGSSSFAGGGEINASPSSSSSPAAMLLHREAVPKEEENYKSSILSDSMMSSLQQITNNDNAPMSATALLQRAAQMGSTRSGGSQVFGAGFGLVGSTLSDVGGFVSSHQSRNIKESEAYHYHRHQGLVDAGAIYNHGVSYSRNNNNANSPLEMMTKQRRQTDDENSMTRDFLGVGGGGVSDHQSRPLTTLQENIEVQQLKFASEMDMSGGNYMGNN